MTMTMASKCPSYIPLPMLMCLATLLLIILFTLILLPSLLIRFLILLIVLFS